MLILAHNGKSLYDTASGTGIHVMPDALGGAVGWNIVGSDETLIASFKTEDEAMQRLAELAQVGGAVRA